MQAHPGGVTSLALTDDGRFVASGGCDGTVRVFELMTMTVVRVLLGPSRVTSLSIDSSENLLMASFNDSAPLVYDLTTGKSTGSLSQLHSYHVAGAALGRVVVSYA